MGQYSAKDCEEIWSAAEAAADAARAVTLEYFRKPNLTAENKLEDGFDPVTVADRKAEAAMRAVFGELRPDDGILGEEMETVAGTTGLTWVLDPIDGTRGFISGTPTWGVLIACSDESGPIMGLIDQPHIGERFMGGLGRARFRGPHWESDLQTRKTTEVNQATLFTTFPEVGSPAQRDAFERVARQVKLTRYGCDCYAYALLAAGHVDLVIEAGLNAYDIQAPIGVIQAAGGVITDWAGNPAHGGGTALAAATPELHAQALALLQAEVA